MVYTKVYTEKKEDVMTTITPELKTFMEDLWGAEGDFINTPIGRGRIENVRTKAGIDLEVIVKIPDMDGFTLFSGMELFEMERV
jgi:hypothetical protein|tara:strand:- start:98 stop:349 length:252 start_codon:yes stop_codon:yes gene_type:complete